jgi:DDE superfamily endonuclease
MAGGAELRTADLRMLRGLRPRLATRIGGISQIDGQDGLPAHRSRRMLDWVQSQREWLSVERLPGYAPDLNPLEQAWSNLKSQELANLCSDTIDEVATIAEGGLDRIGTDANLCLAFLRQSGLRL